MTIRINNLSLSLDEDIEILKDKACKKLRVSKEDIEDFKILRESLDARKKNYIKFNYSIIVKCENEDTVVKRAKDKNVIIENPTLDEEVKYGSKPMKERPVIVGMGPAGLFAALTLAKNGYKPIVIERGEAIEKRDITVNRFWKDNILNLESNVQFGEGGAGTFSDGKLTTRIKDPRCTLILEELVKNGAPKEIIYSGKPHVGTDILKTVVVNMRKEIISLGGEIHFNSKLRDIKIRDKKILSLKVNNEEIPCENLILAIGHSSRDTYEMLYKNNIDMIQKAFAIGVRIEHRQELINNSQYGEYKNHPRLKAAEYKLTYKTKEGRGVYSFCMCPGGIVVGAASEEGRLVTNGMSYYKRDMENANAAMVVAVDKKDFKSDNPLAAMEFQRHYESLAFKLGGGDYRAPVQLVEDFMEDRISTKVKEVTPSYTNGFLFQNLKDCLPKEVTFALKEAMTDFDRKIKGYKSSGAVMTGIESRTSAPVRILRDENLQSISAKGIYPCGEGAGYAGGIISAGVDGIKCAENIMKEFKPLA